MATSLPRPGSRPSGGDRFGRRLPSSWAMPGPFKPGAPVPIHQAMDSAQGSDQRKIRVLIVDDHSMIRHVVRLACEARPRIEVVGEAATGQEALDLARSLAPDVIV